MTAKTTLFSIVSLVLMMTVTSPGVGEEREKIKLNPVLMVVDVQNAWMPHMDKKDVESAPQKINELIALFREFELPVIRVYHTNLERGPEPGSEPFEFADSIAVTDEDVKIVKNYPSSFTKTNLEQVLREGEHNVVFLCGLSATGCVLATYFGAQDREFMVVMVKDTLLSNNASYTDVIEDICSSMTIDEVKETLKDPYL
jgi:nicotinamidase-related amidase